MATALAPAYAAVRDIRQVRVWDRHPEKAAALADKLSADGFNAAVAPDLDAAVRDAEIVTCATLAQQPLVRRVLACKPARMSDLIGSFQPFMRESADERRSPIPPYSSIRKKRWTNRAISSRPSPPGVFSRDRVPWPLEALCRRQHPGRRAADEITVYKAVGAASEDLGRRDAGVHAGG